MKALLTASNTQILFFLKRYISHAFTNLLENIARKIFYTLFPFGFSLACLYKTQEKALKTATQVKIKKILQKIKLASNLLKTSSYLSSSPTLKSNLKRL